MILPIKKGNIQITSPYGYRLLNGYTNYHSGLDIIGNSSDEVVSVSDGTVLWSQMVTDKNNRTWEWGNYVAVNGNDGNTVYYCHLAARKVSAGQRVKAGDVIGIMGNTGYSFGKHLHFEVRSRNVNTIDPAAYLKLPNAETVISEKEYYSDDVCKICGFTDGTRTYINKYMWAADLWRKLSVFLRRGTGGDKRAIIKACGFLPHTVEYIDKYKFADEFWRKAGTKH